MNKIFEKLYYAPETGYTGLNELYRRARSINPKIKRLDVKIWIEKQPTYTLHKPSRKKFTRNKVLVSGIDEQWQCDLADLSSLSIHNDGFKFLLTCIDIFSKFAWAIPLKTKNSKEVLNAFRNILDSSGRKPVKLQSDAGTEFSNKDFQKFLKSQYIEFFTTRSEMKASIVERFNRTIKEKMWRYFSKNNTYRYIDILENLMKNYNHSMHRTIGTYPANVTLKNENEILNKAFRIKPNIPIMFKFEIGDKVRISKVKKLFEKGYWPNWTEEYFIIENRLHRNPPVYILKDQMGEKLDGVFYEVEIQKITATDADLFVIEKIMKTRKTAGKTDYLVRWRGYPPKFDSWVSNLAKL
jgi:transposase InsO family protein